MTPRLGWTPIAAYVPELDVRHLAAELGDLAPSPVLIEVADRACSVGVHRVRPVTVYVPDPRQVEVVIRRLGRPGMPVPAVVGDG